MSGKLPFELGKGGIGELSGHKAVRRGCLEDPDSEDPALKHLRSKSLAVYQLKT